MKSNTTVVQDRFLSILERDTDATGEGTAAKIELLISDLGLDPSGLQAISRDGAGNMCGRTRGAATLLRESFPGLTQNTHCYNYVLNLATVRACQLQPVQYMMEFIKAIHYCFEKSPKKLMALTKAIKNAAELPQTGKRQIQDVC